MLQHEIRKTHAKSQAHEWIEELALIEIVGKGGFGVVYKVRHLAGPGCMPVFLLLMVQTNVPWSCCTCCFAAADCCCPSIAF